MFLGRNGPRLKFWILPAPQGGSASQFAKLVRKGWHLVSATRRGTISTIGHIQQSPSSQILAPEEFNQGFFGFKCQLLTIHSENDNPSSVRGGINRTSFSASMVRNVCTAPNSLPCVIRRVIFSQPQIRIKTDLTTNHRNRRNSHPSAAVPAAGSRPC